MSAGPFLPCPACDADLIQATHRARVTDEGEKRHRDTCRCRWCKWIVDVGGPVRCSCGALAIVDEHDGRAVAVQIFEAGS